MVVWPWLGSCPWTMCPRRLRTVIYSERYWFHSLSFLRTWPGAQLQSRWSLTTGENNHWCTVAAVMWPSRVTDTGRLSVLASQLLWSVAMATADKGNVIKVWRREGEERGRYKIFLYLSPQRMLPWQIHTAFTGIWQNINSHTHTHTLHCDVRTTHQETEVWVKPLQISLGRTLVVNHCPLLFPSVRLCSDRHKNSLHSKIQFFSIVVFLTYVIYTLKTRQIKFFVLSPNLNQYYINVNGTKLVALLVQLLNQLGYR